VSSPTVSICVPTYNGSAYLSECIKSIERQSFGDYEVVLVDDCSTDGTLDLARALARGLDVRFESNKERLGLVGNWNKCLSLARGTWVKFLFQDDILEPDCVKKMLAVGNLGAKLVFCRRNFVFEPQIDATTKSHYLKHRQVDDVIDSRPLARSSDVVRAVLTEQGNFFGEPTAALIHRSLFQKYGAFNPAFRQLCDLEWWIRVGVNEGVGHTAEPLVKFRVHARSATADNLASRGFRTEYLEDLLLLHEFAYNSYFAPLRQQARLKGDRRRFASKLAERSAWLRSLATQLANDPNQRDLVPLIEWQELAAQYPRLRWSLWHIPIALRAIWHRHVGWRWSA
jgi:glycosyltransferase involved in cell wall biosynthesis